MCGGRCVDLDNDRANCGACGNTCTGMLVCQYGGCRCSTVHWWQTQCGTSCVDLVRSRDHCGACDRACAPGESCMSGRCS